MFVAYRIILLPDNKICYSAKDMRFTKRFYFTQEELEWLAHKAVFNELAADILVRYNRRHRRANVLRVPRTKLQL